MPAVFPAMPALGSPRGGRAASLFSFEDPRQAPVRPPVAPADPPEPLAPPVAESMRYFAPRPSANVYGNPYWNFAPGQAQLNNMLLGGYMAAPQAVASNINQAFDNYQANVQYGADRNAALANAAANRGMVRDILGQVLGGGGLGTGANRLQGYRDVNSGQFAMMPGAAATGITTPNLGAKNIQDAQAVAGGMAQPPAAARQGVARKAIPALFDQYQAAANKAGSRNAMDVGKRAREAAAALARSRETTNADLGVKNAQYLADLNTDNARFQVGMTTPLIRALLGNMVDSNLNFMG